MACSAEFNEGLDDLDALSCPECCGTGYAMFEVADDAEVDTHMIVKCGVCSGTGRRQESKR